MEASVRYPELFLRPEERIPDSFWISLRYFNLYRMALAGLFLGTTVVYDDALLGSHNLPLFRYVAAGYLFLGVVLHCVVRDLRDRFELQITLHAGLDIVAIALLMYASGGMRSGLGVMLLISLIGAALVAPRRLTFLYAALATIALLLEQGYWVLEHDAPSSSFLQPGLLAIGYFATGGVTSWLAARVAANERLARQRERELATQTRVNQLVIEDMHDGVLVLDRGGRVMQHNPQAQQLLGTPSLLGASIGGVVPGFAGDAELEVAGRDIRLRPLDRGAGEEFSVLLVEDTSRAREQAQQLKLAALGRLTANIAHEIRNPLAAISHAVELLREEKRDEDRERLARIIHDNTRRLDRLVSDVMSLNRRDRVSAAPLRLQPWLGGFVAEFALQEALPAERFVLETRRESWVEFDREHLHQVMWNLLRNAVRYARAEPGSVRILLDGYGDRVELSVIDNGPGVPEAIQGQLFEPFFTTEAKGTGLGLYLARELCAANRAALDYVDDLPGAHFRIRCRQAKAA